MASISSLRSGLATRLATISGLRTFATQPGSIDPPVAVVLGPELIEWDSAMGRGLDHIVIPIRVYVSRGTDQRAQDTLDGYLAGSGASSVKAAVDADRTLGGACDTSRISVARNYSLYDYGGVDYLGAEFIVDIWARG